MPQPTQDNRQIQRNADGGSGSGGIIGSIGATVGDIGLGGDASAESGDISSIKNIDFAGPVLNRGLSTSQYVIAALAVVAGIYFWRVR